ncbi:dTDP-4-dehydrorhamnose reductase [bacterium]|nr:dTDP-4-dehydrorhamnose reductase [bacterium]
MKPLPPRTERIAVLGAGGQLGGALCALLGKQAKGFGHGQADLAEPDAALRVLTDYRPDLVVNAAAYTQVDKAESEREAAFLVNAHAPGLLAEWATTEDIPLVHFSTDYVFDGAGSAPWREADDAHPLNYYGASKLAGEQAVLASGGSHYIIRLSWVYDAVRRNFFTSILEQAKQGKPLRVVDDQIGAPSYAPDLARWLVKAIGMILSDNPPAPGLYHLCHGGEVSRHGFAEAMVKAAHNAGLIPQLPDVEAVSSGAFATPARRPLNSRLDISAFREAFGILPDDWRDGLARAIASLGGKA